MNILITGNLGYIGQVMVDFFSKKGFSIIGIDTDYYKKCDLIKPQTLKYKQIFKDIRKITKSDLKNVDSIIHLAALSNDPIGELDLKLTNEINYLSSVRLAKLSKILKIERFLFASSCSLYGKSGINTVKENNSLEPLTAYAKSKVRTERDLNKLADKSFSPVLLRNSTVFGLSPRLRFDVVVNNLTGWAYTTNKIRIMSDGCPWRPLIHVEDICQAFYHILMADKELIHNQAFNVGENSLNYQIKDIANIIQKENSNCDIIYTNEHGPDTRSYRVNFDKIHKCLPKFKCKHDVIYGVKELIKKFDEINLTYDEFVSSKFTRLKRLKELKEKNFLDEGLYWRN